MPQDVPTGAFWNERFGREGYIYGTEPNEFLAESATRLAPKSRVLSLGEGEGRNGVYLASLGHSVLAVDGSTEGQRKAFALADKRGVALEYVVADLMNWTPSSPLDAVVSIFCHLPSTTRHVVHRRAWEALRPGGLFVLEAYRPEQLSLDTGGPKNADMLVTLEDLRGDLAGARELVAVEHRRNIVEGAGHSGIAEVVDAVFEKPGR
ncbi:MAG: class I SAM-dependent methyltransferase [Polyangiales bacterium]|nr:class I SAM-dependent methyltransferase [Myxococcales bacterium]